jgi:prepilin-type N-terminal cleavage/methylation domain-containing protein
MESQNRAFTLAELLIVIVILGILGGIALPRFFPQAEKGRVAEAVAMLSAIRQGEESYRLEKGDYLNNPASDTDWESLGMENPNEGSRNFNYSVSSGTGADGKPSFTALATRCATTGAGDCKSGGGTDYGGKEIGIYNSGTWCGSHPFRPDASTNSSCA